MPINIKHEEYFNTRELYDEMTRASPPENLSIQDWWAGCIRKDFTQTIANKFKLKLC